MQCHWKNAWKFQAVDRGTLSKTKSKGATRIEKCGSLTSKGKRNKGTILSNARKFEILLIVGNDWEKKRSSGTIALNHGARSRFAAS